MQPLALLSILLASSAAATDVVVARVFSEKNYAGKHRDAHGFGCVNVDKGTTTFTVLSIHIAKSVFCYAYTAKNCKGSRIYFTRDIADLHLDPTNSIHCVDASN
ncbi:hypothetical protein FDECE_5975 [Fusarium decemcellulare]|uniref:Uncharacterized protein n=1 Tax=Fusarium decemcellulare TaxID=57161 RepID=A0ACC1SU98_9HYPO|nr:hypothetical protein FDECE_5975 [Fusarium decemcellulare]KAJ3546245.1 hypothetical protein NM208_g2096 [Fusarium decemcellulare]